MRSFREALRAIGARIVGDDPSPRYSGWDARDGLDASVAHEPGPDEAGSNTPVAAPGRADGEVDSRREAS